MSETSVSISTLAYYLALIGGILMIIFGLLNLIGSSVRGVNTYWEFTYVGAVTLVCGLIAVIGAKSAGTLAWAIVLIVVGIVGGGLGGLLVLLGGIFGLVKVLAK
jgi:hypothetical protein